MTSILPFVLTFCSPKPQRADATVETGQGLRHPVEAFSPYRELPAQSLLLNETVQ